MDQKKFKEWYLHYFGMHSVAVAGCIMYAPYYPQLVFTIIQTILFTIACVMQSCVLVSTTRVVFNIILIVSVIMDILLLFSLAMGVGAAGYDSNSKTCFLLQWLPLKPMIFLLVHDYFLLYEFVNCIFSLNEIKMWSFSEILFAIFFY